MCERKCLSCGDAAASLWKAARASLQSLRLKRSIAASKSSTGAVGAGGATGGVAARAIGCVGRLGGSDSFVIGRATVAGAGVGGELVGAGAAPTLVPARMLAPNGAGLVGGGVVPDARTAGRTPVPPANIGADGTSWSYARLMVRNTSFASR